MWLEHWNLARDPFQGHDHRYVPTPVHEEAVARLLACVASGDRVATVRGAAGLGKTAVLLRAAGEARRPGRRVAYVSRPGDDDALALTLAERLGARVARSAPARSVWQALADAVRVCHWQRVHPVLLIDDLPTGGALDRLRHLGQTPAHPLTVVAAPAAPDDLDESASPWQLAIRLVPLGRAETGRYLAAKLGAVGRTEPAFTTAAVTRVFDLSEGVPRGIDRLAALALMTAALDKGRAVEPGHVELAARECLTPWAGSAA